MNKHILVVDDNCQIRSLLQQILECESYEVDTASDGLTAWETLAHSPQSYGVVLLDLNMPRMDGLQLIEALRQQEEAWLHQIIAFSGDHDAIQQAVQMGISRVLIKPFDLEEILALISTCLV